MALLEVRGLVKHFLGVTAVDRVDLVVEPGELVSLIGPNGSGKTTLFNCITGYLAADDGRALFRGRDLTKAAPHRVARLGVARTFQQVSVFPRLSVLDNLLVFLQQHQEEHLLARLLRTRRVRRLEAEAVARARRMLDLVGLTARADAAAGSLSYGQRKLLAFAGALMPDPDLLLLDEPAAAVNPTMINQMKEHILGLHRQGKTVLLVEHNMDVVMDISQRVVVLDHGQKIAEGSPEAIRRDPRVIEAYLAADAGALLELHDVVAGYEEVEVLRRVSMAVRAGEIVCIIGANGAGKSTLLRTIFGMLPPREGTIRFAGADIAGRPPTEVLRRGIGYVPQGRCNFPAMSVEENLEMGAYLRRDARIRRDIDSLLARFPMLGAKRDDPAGTLSGGQQQILEMAIALLLQPRLLMVDEPSLGLDPRMVEIVFDTILAINREGTTILMVEQNAKKALSVSHRGFVLELGRNRFEGTGRDLLEDPEVRQHYLGG